jgi:hypothetical protein
MLILHWREFCRGYILLSLILWAFAGYAHRINADRSADDPEKRDYHPAAVFLAPITWPLFLFGWLSLFVIRAFLYGVFLFLFTIALVVIRKPFLLIWLEKVARKVGGMLLKANTFLIRQISLQWATWST